MRTQLPVITASFDGETYEIRMLDGIESFRLYTRLVTAAGGGLGALGSMKGGGTQEELVVRAIGSVLGSMSPELLEEVRNTFAGSCCVHDGDKRPELKRCFGMHFAGRPAHMTRWIIECMKVNFADFLDESGPLASLIGKAKALVKEGSSPLQTGTTSG